MSFVISSPLIICVESGIRMLQPLMIGRVVRYLSNPDCQDAVSLPKEDCVSYETARGCVAGIVVTTVLLTISIHHGFVKHMRHGNNLRSALTHLIYKKVLRLSMSSFTETDIGQILNILANDLNRFEEVGFLLVYLVAAPLASIFSLCITYRFLGTSSLAGFVILVLFVPFQGIMGRLFNRFRRNTTEITDKRVNLMSEVVSAMKLIKVYCWEQPFARVIADIRSDEIHAMKNTYYLEGINSAVFFVATKVILFACFIAYVIQTGSLDAEAVFVTMSIFNAIRVPVTRIFPNAIGLGGESFVALSRVNDILLLEERSENAVQDKITSSTNLKDHLYNGVQQHAEEIVEKGSITMNKFCGKWTNKIPKENLMDINISVKPGELLMVVGSVGSGKTCLLYSLLNEIERVSGTCCINGSISYASQESWCFGASIRQNILLGNLMSDLKYNKVIEVCGLERDFKLFDMGDETFVGEKGYNLSGGQKARVSLARAVYHEADYYLLDDPLSAVDPKVANHVFEKCIKGYLKGKTVVLVTHQLQFLRRADKIAVLKEGKLIAFGGYNELATSNVQFLTFLDKKRKEEARKESLSRQKSLSLKGDTEDDLTSKSGSVSVTVATGTSMSSVVVPATMSSPNEAPKEHPRDVDRQELKVTGAVSKRVIWDYFRSGGSVAFILFTLFASFASQGLYHFTDLWLAAWTQDLSNYENAVYESNGEVQQKSLASGTVFDTNNGNIILYTVLIVILFVAAFIRMILCFYLSLNCSINLHDMIFRKVLRAPMTFFENNPLGRILNRFTRDMGIVDILIPRTIVELNLTVFDVLGSVFVCMVVNPWLIIPTIILAVVCYPMREYYVRTGRDLHRLDSIARSPVYNHLTATFDGLITIRAFKLELKCEEQYIRYLKDSVACRFLVFYAIRVLGLSLDMFANLYILCVCLVLIESPVGAIPGGDAGLILSQSLLLIGVFQYCVRMTSEFENQMTSAERVLEYGQLPSEAELRIPGKIEDKDWPSNGNIIFKGVNLRYSPDAPPVLKDLTFKIKAGEKIGIVGRTGAGKSSLISILFRLVEPEGNIIIDNIDIKTLGLHELRSKISIIPQDPSLFSGTVRENLDPFKEYNDVKMWEALSEAHLTVTIRSMGGLDAKVSEGGANLSVGQRQLLCMARALLKKNKILVMDEATANVDQKTDEVIQETIKTTFTGNTVLTVAHRLNTIIDMDKVMVMDAGRVVEFDEPYILLRNVTGVFYSMVKQTGPDFERMLHSLAETSHSERQQRRNRDAESEDGRILE